jgi:protein-disulfide isomerase
MRTVLLFLALAAAACHHEDTKGERDRKRDTDKVTHDTPPSTTTAVPAIAAPEDMTVYKVPLGTSPAIGGKSPLVTIVEFGDFQCPFCLRAEKTLSTLRGQYGDDLRVVWKNEPMAIHTRAKPAAELAMDAADQKKDFWAVHDELFGSQSDLSDAALARIASGHGVKLTGTHHKSLDDDHALAASFGITGTPVFFVNGRKLVGAQSTNAFRNVIDSELAFAKAQVAQGTPRDKIYDTVTALPR